MGMRGPFSRSSFSSYDLPETKNVNKLPNPDPNNYKILRSLTFNNWVLLEVKYPDCTNYEGRKLLLFRNTTLDKIMSQKSLDPHFSNNVKFISPFARFEPSNDGWIFAAKFMEQN